MEQNEGLKPAVNESPADAGIVASSSGSHVGMAPSQQSQSGSCPTCGRVAASTVPSYVYALGRVEPRFPTIGVEKEFAQATGQVPTAGLTNRQALYEILTQNPYLVRQLCWVLTVQGLETYILQPHNPAEFGLLADTLRRNPSLLDIDAVIGRRGPMAPPELCNGLIAPIVVFDQLYTARRDALLASIPRSANVDEEQFKASSEQLFDYIIQMTDNAGATDEHRSLNYLALRYPRIYEVTYDANQREYSLSGVEVRPSRLSGTRKIVAAIFWYTHRRTDVTEKHFVRVDVTEEFPFLVTKMSLYYDR